MTSSTHTSESEFHRKHQQRALAQTVTDEQMSPAGIRDLNKTLTDSETLPPDSFDKKLHSILLDTLDDSSLGDKNVDFYIAEKTPLDRDADTDNEAWTAVDKNPFNELSVEDVSQRMDSSNIPGRYEILKLLGTGATGQVFAVKDNNLDRVLAVKFMHPKDIEHPKKNDRFIAEAAVTAKLDHPNILPLHDLDYTDGCIPFFSMRLASGQTLEEAIANNQAFQGNPLDIILKKIDIIAKVCDAIAYTHNKGIVHGDIKPGNIMIGEFGDVLLLDWGTSTTVEQRAENGQRILGTPIYMSPEQARKECCDQLSDVYCIGSTLMHLISGRFPIYSDDLDTFWDLKRDGWYEDFNSEEMRYIPPRLIAIIRHCLEAKSEDRYQSVSDLLEDLRAFQKGDAVSVYHDPIVDQLKRVAKKNKKSLLVAGVCCLCVICIGYFIYQEKLKELSQWHPIYQSDFSNASDTFANDWIEAISPDWTTATVAYTSVADSPYWSLSESRLQANGEGNPACTSLVSSVQSTGNLKVTWTVHTDRNPRNLNMFIAGKNRYNAYLFHIGGFNQEDQIRLTKYKRIQTLDIHTLEQSLKAHSTYTFTAIKEGSRIQLYMDDALVIDYTDPIPYVGPQHENFGFELINNSYSISNILAWNQPLPQKISPIIIADDYFSHGHFQLALETYDDIRANYSNMAATALFRSAQCLYNLDKKIDARLRLKQFMKTYPGHPYQVHAFSSLCSIDLDLDDWDRLYNTLATLSAEFRNRPEIGWLKHVLTNAIAQKHHINQTSFILSNPYQNVQDAYKEIIALDAYFDLGSIHIDSIGAHQNIIARLMEMGRYQELVNLYPTAKRSASAFIRLGDLATASSINPTGGEVLHAHALRQDSAYLTTIINAPNVSWSEVARINSIEFHTFFTALCPEGHPYLSERTRLKMHNEKIAGDLSNFNALIEMRKYAEAVEVYKKQPKHWFAWKYGQILAVLGREDIVLNNTNDTELGGITRIKAYSSLYLRLWIAGKHEQAQKLNLELLNYVNGMCPDPVTLIFPHFLEWTRTKDRDLLAKNLMQSAESYNGRYSNYHQKTFSYILSTISEEAFISYIRTTLNQDTISITLKGMHDELAGRPQDALIHYKKSALIFDSDRQQFIAWRIKELGGSPHE